MKKVLLSGVVLALCLTLSVSLLAQENQEKPKPEPKPDPSVQKQADPQKPPEKPEEPQEPPEPTDLEKYIQQLSSQSPQERAYATKELVKMGEKAVPELSKILGVEAFEKQEDLPGELKKQIEKLIEELDSEEWAVREAATKELGEIGEPAEGYLRRVAQFGSPEVKTRAEKLLAKIEEKRRGGKSEEEVEQGRFFARLCAVQALGEIVSKSCDAGLLAALGDREKMISTASLMHLRRRSGWSFGFGPRDLKKSAQKVAEKWRAYLEKPTELAAGESYSFAAKCRAGDIFKTRSLWGFESVHLFNRISSVTTIEGGKRVRKQRKTTYAVVSESQHQQHFADTVESAGTGPFKFTREYLSHKAGSNSFTDRSGAKFRPTGQVLMSPTQLSGSKLEFTCRPGFTDVEVLKGSVNLGQREQLAGNLAGFGLLLPQEALRPGDSWVVPELAALKLLRSFSPYWEDVLNVASVKLKCRLLEVTEKEGVKLARISLLAEFGPQAESNMPAPNVAGNIVRISSFGMGTSMTLADRSLVGDCVFDISSGAMKSFKLFGTLLPSSDVKGVMGNRNQDQTTYGYFKLDVTGSREEAGK